MWVRRNAFLYERERGSARRRGNGRKKALVSQRAALRGLFSSLSMLLVRFFCSPRSLRAEISRRSRERRAREKEESRERDVSRGRQRAIATRKRGENPRRQILKLEKLNSTDGAEPSSRRDAMTPLAFGLVPGYFRLQSFIRGEIGTFLTAGRKHSREQA